MTDADFRPFFAQRVTSPYLSLSQNYLLHLHITYTICTYQGLVHIHVHERNMYVHIHVCYMYVSM